MKKKDVLAYCFIVAFWFIVFPLILFTIMPESSGGNAIQLGNGIIFGIIGSAIIYYEWDNVRKIIKKKK